MNRKGAGRQLMFFPFFVILMIVWIGIWLGVVSFYGKGYDFRESESVLLANQLRDCFFDHSLTFFEEDFNVYETCRLNEKVIEDGHHLIYVKAINGEAVFAKGVSDFLNQCEFEGGKQNKAFPKCVTLQVISEGEEYMIVAGSSQNTGR